MTMMQEIFKTAQSIDVNRTKLISQTVSRNGRLLVASRNWVNPWRFTVTPKPVWDWATYRSDLETVVNADRYDYHVITLGANAFNSDGANWMAQYQGDIPSQCFGSGITIQTATNNLITVRFYGNSTDVNSAYYAIENGADDFVVFAAGDLIQASDNPYPHSVKYTITKQSEAKVRVEDEYWEFDIQLHRGWLGTAPAGAVLKVGTQCTFKLITTKMPTYRMIPLKRFEFTSDFEFMEFVE